VHPPSLCIPIPVVVVVVVTQDGPKVPIGDQALEHRDSGAAQRVGDKVHGVRSGPRGVLPRAKVAAVPSVAVRPRVRFAVVDDAAFEGVEELAGAVVHA
jgi:hypothetical protein